MKENEMNSARCKACDKKFHPMWREEHECYEELCWVCLAAALDISDDTNDETDFINSITASYEVHEYDSEYE